MERALAVTTGIVIAVLGTCAALAQGPGAAAPAPGSIHPLVLSPKVDEAIQDYGAGDVAGAAKACEDAIAAQPDCEPEARMVLAELLAAQGQFDQAEAQDTAAMAKAVQMWGPDCPVAAEAKARLARITQQASDFSGLLDIAQGEAKASDPEQAAGGEFVVGVANFLYGRDQDAIQAYEKLIADHPNSPYAVRARGRLAALYAITGQPDKAKALRVARQAAKQEAVATTSIASRVAGLQDTIKTKPDTPEAIKARYEVGCVCAEYGKNDDALADLSALVKDKPDSPYAARAFGVLEAVYAQTGQADQATAALAQLADAAKSPAIYWRLGLYYERLGDKDQAKAAFAESGRPATGTAPPKPAAAGGGKTAPSAPAGPAPETPEQRMKRLEGLIGAKPKSPEAVQAQYQLGCLCAAVGRYDQAIKQLTAAVRVGGDQPVAARAFGMLAAVYIQADRQAEAATTLPQLAATAPKSMPMLARLALFYRETGDTAKAAATLAEAGEMQNVQALADSFRENGGKKIAKLQALIAAKPRTPEAAEAEYRIGCIYAEYGKTDQAMAEFTNLVKTQPDSPPAGRGFEIMQVLYTREGQSDEAGKVLPALVQDDCPKSPQMLAELCRLYRRTHDVKALEQTCDKLESHSAGNPQVARALLARCWAYADVGNADSLLITAGRLGAKYPQTEEAMLGFFLAADRSGMAPEEFAEWAGKTGINRQTMVMAVDLAREAYTTTNWEQLAAALVRSVGPRAEDYAHLPIMVRGRAAAYLGIAGHEDTAREVFSTITAADLARSAFGPGSDAANALNSVGKAFRLSIWASEWEVRVRGGLGGGEACYLIWVACVDTSDREAIRQELIPYAEEALAKPGPDAMWPQAEYALIWAYQFVGDAQKAEERARYWLGQAKGRDLACQCGASYALAEVLMNTGETDEAAKLFETVIADGHPWGPWDFKSLMGLAVCKVRQGDAAGAESVLKQAAAHGAKASDVAAAQDLLRMVQAYGVSKSVGLSCRIGASKALAGERREQA